jgi:hypothetical protein
MSDDLSQPVLTSITKNSHDDETIANYITTPDFKNLVQIYGAREKISQIERNLGTIIHPRFEYVTERTTIIAISCLVTPK